MRAKFYTKLSVRYQLVGVFLVISFLLPVLSSINADVFSASKLIFGLIAMNAIFTFPATLLICGLNVVVDSEVICQNILLFNIRRIYFDKVKWVSVTKLYGVNMLEITSSNGKKISVSAFTFGDETLSSLVEYISESVDSKNVSIAAKSHVSSHHLKRG